MRPGGVSVAIGGGLALLCCAWGDEAGANPFQTDDTDTAPAGRLQVEAAVTTENRDTDDLQDLPYVEVTYGLGGHAEVAIEGSWSRFELAGEDASSGLGDVALESKVRFLDQAGRGIDVATEVRLDFNPDVESELGLLDRTTEIDLALLAARGFGPLSLWSVAAYTIATSSDESGTWRYGLAGGWTHGPLRLAAEIYGEASTTFSENELIVAGGVTWTVSSRLSLSLSAGRTPRSSSSGEPMFLGYAGGEVVL